MNSQQLINLIKINECGSISKASEVLFLTPQALSTSIKTLEKELGISLLTTTYLGSSLTKEGTELVEIAQDFFSKIESLIKQERSIEKRLQIKNIHFATLPGICSVCLEDLFEYNQNEGYNFKIDLQIYPYNGLIDKIQNRELKYAFTYVSLLDGKFLNDGMENLNFESIQDLGSAFILVKSDHPLAKYKSVSLKSTLRYPMVLRESTECMFSPLFDIIAEPPELYAVPSPKLFRVTLDNTMGVLYTCGDVNRVLASIGDLKAVKIKEKYTSKFGIISLKKDNFSQKEIEELSFFKNFFHKNPIKWYMDY